MTKRGFLTSLAAIFFMVLQAQETVMIHRADGVVLATPITSTDSIDFDDVVGLVRFHLGTTVGAVEMVDIDSITFGTAPSDIRVAYCGAERPVVVNPYAFRGVDISVVGGTVVVNNARTDELTYELSGSGTGGFKLYSAKKQVLRLNGLVLTGIDGPAINIQSKKKTTVELVAETHSRLEDVSTYTPCGDEDAKGAFFSEGQLVFCGDGSLSVLGRADHAICSDDYVRVESGTVVVEGAVGDGVNANDRFEMSGGMLQVSGTVGDCVDGGAGNVAITGGTLRLTASTADTKALKCDSLMNISGGTLEISLTGSSCKGLKSATDISISGGLLTFEASGGVVVESGETSYCSAIKCDGNMNISGGNLQIRHTGTSGKGISVDGALEMTAGEVEISVTGNGGTYTNASNTSDTYNATCIKVDGDLQLLGGTLRLSASGTGGKCISVDGASVYGNADGGPAITAATSGSPISGSSGSGGGGGGRPGGNWRPGGTSSSTGGKPKVIRGEGDVTVENGLFVLSSAAEGGEGIESKTALTVNGGTIEANTYDDGLQASRQLVVNGGKIFVNASNNDGIDSNGTLMVAGGVVISCGATQPEEGFDCDQNTFSVTGGTLVGVGGATSTPTSSVTTQCVAIYSGKGSQNTEYTVCNSATGEHMFSFVLPRSYSQMTMLFSTPGMAKSAGYTIYTGGTKNGGEEFHGLTTGATFGGGTQVATFTTGSMVTTVR